MANISIIIPVYNVNRYLEKCLETVINQTYIDFDVFLIDDGSTDSSPNICDEYSNKYSFVHTFHKTNGGISSSRNYGVNKALELSDSEYITFIDSDDYVSVEYLSSLIEGLQKHNDGVVCSNYKVVFNNDGYQDLNETKINQISTESYFLKQNINSVVPRGNYIRKMILKILLSLLVEPTKMRQPPISYYSNTKTSLT